MTAVADRVEIRVLSVRQPFASAFFDSRPGRTKFIENRTWRPPSDYSGPIFIHASSLDRKPKPDELDPPTEGCDPADVTASILAMWDDPPPIGLPVGQIIGSVNVWEVIDGEALELLSLVPKGAKKLPKEVAACLRPSEREGFLDKWQHVRERLAKIDEVHFMTHWFGPECWLVDQPRLLREPIVTGGRLNLWKFQAEAARLSYKE